MTEQFSVVAISDGHPDERLWLRWPGQISEQRETARRIGHRRQKPGLLVYSTPDFRATFCRLGFQQPS